MSAGRALRLAAGMLAALCLGTGARGEVEPMTQLDASERAGRYYANPSAIHEIGDPCVLAAEGAYWMFSTSSPLGYKVYRSTDMVNWEDMGLAFRCDSRKGWCVGSFWAPEAYCVDGRYYLFYSAQWFGKGTMRIGVAASDAPGGPYKDLKNEPLFDPGYATIDASLFIDDDGAPYLLYARDCSENIVGGIHTSQVYIVRLKDDFTGTAGEPALLLTPDQDWEMFSGDEWRWNEGPFMIKHGEKYWLFYSANYYQGKEYGVGAAWADSPTGPFVKTGESLLKWQEDEQGAVTVSGPGHNKDFVVGEERFTSYHTHFQPWSPNANRQMAIDRMGFHADGTPYFNGPTLAPQLRPLADLGLENKAARADRVSTGDGDASYLTDGDWCIAESSAAYLWKPSNAKRAWAEFSWDAPQTVDCIQIYPARDALGAGKLILNGESEIPVDFGKLEPLPGSCLTFDFEPTEVVSLRLEMDAPNAIGEILAIGSAEN